MFISNILKVFGFTNALKFFGLTYIALAFEIVLDWTHHNPKIQRIVSKFMKLLLFLSFMSQYIILIEQYWGLLAFFFCLHRNHY